MEIEVRYRPAHSLARVTLTAGEAVVAESGAMVGMSTNVQIKTEAGGVMSGIKRMFGGESFFRNTFYAAGGPGELLLAHALPGDMVSLPMTLPGYFVQGSSYIASTPNVQIDTKLGGFRTFFAGEGLFVLKATSDGSGSLLIGAFGGVQELECRGDLVIDTGHLVAWDATLDYRVGKSGSGWIASWLSGEGLVCHFSGHGRIWIQTRNPSEYGHNIGSLLPPRRE
jgi:uncharacterized protein (TIGR00266 family)